MKMTKKKTHQILYFPLGYYLIWFFLAWIDRFLFFISHFSKSTESAWKALFFSYLYGLKLDLSMAAYICVLPFLFYGTYFLITGKRGEFFPLKIYTYAVALLYIAISIVNTAIYKEWGMKISNRVVETFLETPQATLASSNVKHWLLGFLFFVLLIFYIHIAWRFLRRSINKNTVEILPWYWRMSIFLIAAFLLFTVIRGGYGRAALNPSVAYHSSNSFYNHVAVNTHWAFLKEVTTRNIAENPYKRFSKEEAAQRIKPLFETQGAYERMLTRTDINVVLIVLEGFVGDLVESLGGEKGVSPHMEKLIEKGVLFNQVYAASDRSDKGIISVFSGFPSQGDESIIKHIPKHEKLPGITEVFDSLGYATSFYHGGQSEFYNFKSFMLSHGVDKVIDQTDFKPNEVKSSWGVYDGLVFQRMLKDLNQEKEPFFSSHFTISNHEPFELEGDYHFGKNTAENKFRSTAYYTDSVLMEFIEGAKREDWYKNTLFIVVADHGHRLPANWNINDARRYHIPLLFFGEVIKPEFQGLKVEKIMNQSDLPGTLLAQLGIENRRFPWSRNVMAEDYQEYAFYTTKGVLGVKTPQQELGYDQEGEIFTRIVNDVPSESENLALLDTAISYYQTVYDQFLAY